MANGIITGSGTQAEPWIVEDGWDFNALRNIGSDVWAPHWIELAEDISLAMFPAFTPIPMRYFNIDGKGHKITNVSINAGTGLFETLRTWDTKNIRIEGTIIHASSWLGDHIGFLCSVLELHTLNGSGGSTSNIQCFGSITARLPNNIALHGIGGCFGLVRTSNAATALPGIVTDCAFYGMIDYTVAFSLTTQPSGTNARGAGGITGIIDTDGSGRRGVTISRCVVVATFRINGGAAAILFGGIAAIIRSSQASNIGSCIAVTRMEFSNAAATTQMISAGGIASHNTIGNNTTISNCGAHMEVVYNPPAAISTLLIGGILGVGAGNVVTSYAVLRFNNSNSVALPGSMLVRGIGLNANNTNSFFDADVLAEGFTGEVANAAWGRTTAQLQNQKFLEIQGWVFADV